MDFPVVLLLQLALGAALVGAQQGPAGPLLRRLDCAGNVPQPLERVITADRLMGLRKAMARHDLDAYIVPYTDEHQNEWVSDHNQRLRWVSGFSGAGGSVAVVTRSTPSNVREEAVLWTDSRFTELADQQLDCSWQLRNLRSPMQPVDWLLDRLSVGDKVGADGRVVLHQLWDKWADRLASERSIELVDKEEVVDDAWRVRPPRPRLHAFVHKMGQRGLSWGNRVLEVREAMKQRRVDSLILTALDEIAWLLNIRGRDLPHAPLLTAYVWLGQHDLVLYVDRDKVPPSLESHLKSTYCSLNRMCAIIRPYETFWDDLARQSNRSTVWISNHPRLGASKAVETAARRWHELHYEWSPVIPLKSVKNEVEVEAMRSAHALDGAAMCELLSFLEDLVGDGDADKWTETRVATRVDFFRRPELSFHSTAFPTHVGYGPHGALPHYVPRNSSDLYIGRDSTVVIDSGGQYENGTTDVARTLHYGTPTRAQVEAYTRVLQGLIDMSRASVPAAVGAHGLDSLARHAVWEGGENYGHPSGHGIGAFLNVHEEPSIFYGDNAQRLQVGNFFTVEPGYYKKNDFGVRLENVLEVVLKPPPQDDPSGPTFYEFRTATLVPFDVKLIDVKMLSPQQRYWLNEYNAQVRREVGEVLKSKPQMTAFYWMMNHTLYVPEHCCPPKSSAAAAPAPVVAVLALALVLAAMAAPAR